MNKPNRISARKPVYFSLMAGGISALWYYRAPMVLAVSALRDQQAVSAYFQQFGMLGPAVLFVMLVIQVVFAVLPGHALILASGYLYGFPYGAVVTAGSTILGGQLSFFIARHCGRKIVNHLASPRLLDHWDRLADRQGSMFFLLTFLLPIFPSDLLCYVAGLGKVSPRRFLIVNILGRLPCAIILTLVGAYGLRLPTQFWLVVLAGCSVLLAIWLYYSKRIRSDPGAICYSVISRVAEGYQHLFCLRREVRGETNLPSGPKILAANHPNATDAFFLPGILSDRLYVLIQGNLFNLPVIGWLLTHSRMIPVWPDQRELAFEQACEHLRQGHTILIFPEGKLNPSGEPMKVGTGAVRMSLATGAPIIPVGIHVARDDARCVRMHTKEGVRTGWWQVRGCCTFNFGAAWHPSAETSTGDSFLAARLLTSVLMEKVYSLVQAESREERITCESMLKYPASHPPIAPG